MFIKVKIKANSYLNVIEKIEGEYLIIKVKSPRDKGLANKDLIKTLSKEFSIPKSSIKIKSGEFSPKKVISIDDAYQTQVHEKLSELA